MLNTLSLPEASNEVELSRQLLVAVQCANTVDIFI